MAEPGVHPSALPESVAPYSKSAIYDEESLPAALQSRHTLKAGTWGRLHVVDGKIRFVYLEPELEERTVNAGEIQIVPPEVPHHVELDGPVRLFLEFYR